ncbi:hypothetical protein [Sphingomonas sp. TREG-RG-20F-R18-01]|uniref:hypothetical protein n=1 Tax=Sphingomonas sp. TREG-RG-20F-R18-01 TaxID=2914982 RepID=UPI001F58369F|nr:hypothetical protein [Sphingomonas sp. TREG-RG-20F-R18-01]
MSLARPASFTWLALHELRLAFRARPRRGVARWIGYLLLAAWCLIGVALAWGLRDQPIPIPPAAMTGLLAICLLALSFMTAQAMIGSQRTLYQSGDLQLLLSAPIPGRTVLLAKLLGIVATIALTYAVLVLPIVVPVAVLGHPRLFGLVAVLVALALVAASLGLGLTLLIATSVGPRAARTVGQIAAAVLGGSLFLATQLMPRSASGRSTFVALFERLQAAGIGTTGISGLPARAAFGDPLAIALVLGAGLVLFAGAGVTLERSFLAGYLDGEIKLSRTRPTGRASGRLFHAGLTRTVFAKEWKLLARDPALAFQIVLRLIYLAPLVLGLIGNRHAVPIPAALAFASVLIASQLVGSFAWLTVSAEDAPDLLQVAPVARDAVDNAKLLAAFAMAAPFVLVLPIVLSLQTPVGAVITLAMTVLGGGSAGYVELKLGKPGKRGAFNKRRSGSIVAGILSLLIALVFGGGAAALVFLVGGGMATLR